MLKREEPPGYGWLYPGGWGLIGRSMGIFNFLSLSLSVSLTPCFLVTMM
jgi:hypothetical protein